MEDAELQARLAAYGYANLRDFQTYYGLESDGTLGPITERALLTPRCGFRDSIRVQGRYQWGPNQQDLRYCFLTMPTQLSLADWQSIFRDVMAEVSDACGLRFEEVARDGQPNIVIQSGRRDGPSGVLADAELPAGQERQTPLELTFDERESWDVTGRNGRINAKIVGLHEMGHICGLEHRPIVQGPALLNPTYDPDIKGLMDWDREQLALRSPKRTTPTPTPTPTPAPAPPPGGGYVIRVPGALSIDGHRVSRIG